MIVDIYQTVEYRPQSPFRGWSVPSVRDCWLGQGYYFWEFFIQNAHKWGEKFYTIKGMRYEIFQTEYDNSSETCLNLIDPIQRNQFNEDLDEVFKTCDEKLKFIGASFDLLKEVFPEEYEKYECVRDWPQSGMSTDSYPYVVTENGVEKGKYFLYMPIQVCFWMKRHVGMKSVFVSE